jgi:hypothetical protein
MQCATTERWVIYRTRREDTREKSAGKIWQDKNSKNTIWGKNLVEVFRAKFLAGNQIFFIKTSHEIKIQYNYNLNTTKHYNAN